MVKIKVKKNKVFVYGTLLNNSMRERVLRRKDIGTYAELENYEVVELNILPMEYEVATGLIINVNDDELKILDWYEGVDRDLYKRVEVEIGGEKIFTYQKCDPEQEIEVVEYK